MSRVAALALIVVELAALVAAALLVPAPWSLIGLVVVASASRWLRGQRWLISDMLVEPAQRPLPTGLAVTVGVVAGAAALGLGLLLTPVLVDVTGRAVEWSLVAAVRGSSATLMAMAVLVGAQVVAAELVLRRWLIDRIVDDGGRLAGPRLAPRALATIAIVLAALAEAAITPGHMTERLGAALVGLGTGALYIGSGRGLAGPLACRLTFEVGALTLTWARMVA